MNTLFIDCPTGLSGDMLLAAFLDLGVPEKVVQKPLNSIGLSNSYRMKILEERSYGIRGKKIEIVENDNFNQSRKWKDIRKLISNADWNQSLKSKVNMVFKSLAEAESFVHGIDIEKVHFHEIGALDSLIDIISVCAAIDYLGPKEIICSNPPTGSGKIATSHGTLPVPVPAVVELAKRHNIKLIYDDSYPKAELTTPTGIALMAIFATRFGNPSSLLIDSIGIGLGHRDIYRPNFLRVFQIKINPESSANQLQGLSFESLIVQEAWIDDSTPEDISNFCDQLRLSGAIEVVTQSIQMKKNRTGTLITAITTHERVNDLRMTWLNLGTTIGLRERFDSRWVLPRRTGICTTSLGPVLVKQVMRPNKNLTIKVEHDELVRLSKEKNKSLEEIRKEVIKCDATFKPNEDWKF